VAERSLTGTRLLAETRGSATILQHFAVPAAPTDAKNVLVKEFAAAQHSANYIIADTGVGRPP